jgi:hypothetical protein
LKGGCILLLMIARSFLAITKQNGLEPGHNILNISSVNPLTISQTWWLLTARIGRGFGYVASIGLPISNHLSASHLSPILPPSPFDALTLAQGRLLTSLSDVALATSDNGRASGLAVCFEDLILAFP